MRYILSLDQGTTSTRAIVFDESGNIARVAQREFKQIYPQAGWVEHCPHDILSTSLAVMKEASAGIEISAIGIANQRETVIVWDVATGEPVYNAIVWQCRRTSDECARLVSEGYTDFVYRRTGLKIDAYFSATKIKWILDNVRGAKERAEKGELLFGTVDSYLVWKLTGGKTHATDYTNAARTMLYNIHSLCWDEELLRLFGIPKAMLPKVCPSAHSYGFVERNLPCEGVPIASVAGDQQAALFGQLCLKRGQVKNTYGTGCFLLMNTGASAAVSRHNLVTTLGASTHEKGRPDYVLEGSVFVGGAAVQWLRDEMGLIKTAAESETLARSVGDTNGVYFVPAFVGLGAPYWDSDARGLLCGLTRGAKKEHIVRAVLESIAYRVADVLGAMQADIGEKIKTLSVDGGASGNDFLMQFQADILSAKVVRPATVETTALGVAYLAGLESGIFESTDELARKPRGRTFSPAMDEKTRTRLLAGWQNAVARARL